MNESLQLRASLLIAACLIGCGSSVAWSGEAPSQEDLAFFEKDVRPLLVKHCYECHSGNETDGGLALDSRDGLFTGGDSGTAITSGDPDDSLLIEAVSYKNHDLQMPPSGRLDDREIKTLKQWIKIGVPDPREASTPTGHEPNGMSVEDGRSFWAFQSVGNPSPPTVADKDWGQSPIDAFVLAKLESANLSPATKADRRTLIRRATFDLTGLPPTPADIDAFVSDDSPNAFADLVERLLASPQYGVRWGRHWLDVARYADSNGLDENLAFGNAWRYRDYVIDALNNDKPFDRFLIEQIAGDLLPESNQETKTATGYLVLGAKVLAEPDREKLVMDTIDEQLDAMGKAFLGMTFGCVRCHNHKFDPIQQSDYYALAAIFKGTKTFGDSKQGAIMHWNEHTFANDEQTAQIAKVDASIAEKKKAASSFKNKVIAEIRASARDAAVEYLVAATQFKSTASLNEVASIAEPHGLHPRILHHCRLHLEYHRSDAVLVKWHDLASQSQSVRVHYTRLFADATTALASARKKDPKAKRTGDKLLNEVLAVLDDPSGLLAVPAKPEFAFNADQLRRYDELMEAARIAESNADDLPSAMSVTDATVVSELPIHIRGSHRNFGEPVAREFPEVMRTSSVRPIFPANQSGRLQLARWMASTQHPLTARVYVNRIWSWHFGRGIVGSTDNFGLLGERPSHPELLDYLARYFMQSGWSTKEMHRLLMNSSVYQMESTGNEESGIAVDPENHLLWKFPMQRLDAELIRDSILAVSGRLDATLGGKTVPLRNRQFVFNHTSVDHTKYDSLRRAAYLPVIRNNLYSFFAQFDFPDPTMPTGTRSATVVAPQALLMMNADLVADSADEFATQLISSRSTDAERIDLAYQTAFGRAATKDETNRAIHFVDDLTSRSLTRSDSVDANALHQAWSLLSQSLFASNEFIFIR
ncbi:PSD1 and planctomycete cytochrome C domain-containing protein [Stieleria marina]|uniref:Planctomycete cytochrome C n=1 Tax=Stieleria marina TaxID=1930275 RepID=A0A517P397_9BACT|nr:Planctomycete cytochrome C [Planctomycetes bacterium K23_9]